MARAFQALGYVDDEMFNAFHGAHRQIYVDVANERRVDVFVGMFSMCHEIPIAERLHHEPLTVPLAELLLTKLQIVELNERDERDIYNLCFHHEISSAGEPGIEGEPDRGPVRARLGAVADMQGDDRALPHRPRPLPARRERTRPHRRPAGPSVGHDRGRAEDVEVAVARQGR